MAGKQATRDHYETLGVARDASPSDIKSAFRKAAKGSHPDAGGNEEEFKVLNEAYSVLSDPDRKKDYDRALSYASSERDPYPGGDGRSNRTPSSKGTWAWDPASAQGQDSEMNDVIWQFFGYQDGGSGKVRTPGPATSSVMVEITFEQSLSGVSASVKDVDGNERTVKVPAGTHDGLKLSFPGKGFAGPVEMTVRVKPDPRWGLTGADITGTLPVTPAEAALGGKVETEAPGTGRIRVSVPAGSSDGRKLRVPKHGASRLAPGKGKGDLVLTVRVEVPDASVPGPLSEAYRSVLAVETKPAR